MQFKIESLAAESADGGATMNVKARIRKASHFTNLNKVCRSSQTLSVLPTYGPKLVKLRRKFGWIGHI